MLYCKIYILRVCCLCMYTIWRFMSSSMPSTQDASTQFVKAWDRRLNAHVITRKTLLWNKNFFIPHFLRLIFLQNSLFVNLYLFSHLFSHRFLSLKCDTFSFMNLINENHELFYKISIAMCRLHKFIYANFVRPTAILALKNLNTVKRSGRISSVKKIEANK